MRNTHFGDGFGFGAISSSNNNKNAEVSIDSERKISRKRGTRVSGEGESGNVIRESTNNENNKKEIKFSLAGKELNKSITINQTGTGSSNV